jgi:hypothetical protein
VWSSGGCGWDGSAGVSADDEAVELMRKVTHGMRLCGLRKFRGERLWVYWTQLGVAVVMEVTKELVREWV